MSYAIRTQSLAKQYDTITALSDFDLEVEQGSIFGLLGPNGAGKTTLIRILTTLMRQSAGLAFVDGLDTRTHGKDIRRLIGVVSQENSLDRYLTARENLELHARLHGMEAKHYRRRIDELLELMGLANRQKDFPARLDRAGRRPGHQPQGRRPLAGPRSPGQGHHGQKRRHLAAHGRLGDRAERPYCRQGATPWRNPNL